MFVKRHSRWINIGIKSTIAGLLIYTLYERLGSVEATASVWRAFHSGVQEELWPLALVIILLMPVNWALETLKWRVFTKAFYLPSFRYSLEGVLAGLTLSLITPQRLGDYGGRLLRVPAQYNWQAVTATAVGNLCQLVVLLGSGALGLCYFTARFWPETWEMIRAWLPLIFGIPLLLLAAVFFLRTLGKRLLKQAVLQRFKKQVKQLQAYDSRVILQGLGLSLLRYATYSTQYYLLLCLLGIAPSVEAAFAGIATIFFLQSSVPLPPLAGLLARGEIALLIWGVFDANEFSILAATLSLFIINLLIPALLGLVIVVKTNVLKSFSYEKSNDKNRDFDDNGDISHGFQQP